MTYYPLLGQFLGTEGVQTVTSVEVDQDQARLWAKSFAYFETLWGDVIDTTYPGQADSVRQILWFVATVGELTVTALSKQTHLSLEQTRSFVEPFGRNSSLKT